MTLSNSNQIIMCTIFEEYFGQAIKYIGESIELCIVVVIQL